MMMRSTWLCGLVLGIAAFAARAADPAAATAPGSYSALKAEYDAAKAKHEEELKPFREEYKQAMEAAKSDEEKVEAVKKYRAALAKHPSPLPGFAPRFLDVAVQHPEAADAAEAFYQALQNCGGPRAKDGVFDKAIAAMRGQGYATKVDVRPLLRPLAHAEDDAATAFVRDVIAKNPDRKTQGLAARALATRYRRAAEIADVLEKKPEVREANEKRLGKEKVAEAIAKGKAGKKDADELTALVKEKYADVLPDLSVGQPAPEAVVAGLDGKEARLSALKGKVVVLDFWATWCGPCKAMIPHQREMVEKLKDKPFALVSVSADEERQTAVDFVAKTSMPWTHWWNGDKGGMIDNWDVNAFPTVYIIDAKGTIRYAEVGGGPDAAKAIEETVTKLLAE
jgi:thiol-disulfide isomerase/thioredoxin